MAAKKIVMTPVIKEKLKRDIPSLFKPFDIVIESDDEPDYIFTIKLPTNKQYLDMFSKLEKSVPESTTDQMLRIVDVVTDMDLDIKSITYGQDIYTEDLKEFMKYIKPGIILGLFNKIVELYQ